MTQREKPKAFKEEFAKFFEDPSREKLRELLKNTVGELRQLDFKEDWPEKSAVAKHVLAIANSEGGCIVLGVEDGSLAPKGLSTRKDEAKAIDQLKNYLPETLLSQLEIVDFVYHASEYPKIQGKEFQVLFVPDDPARLPFVSAGAGAEVREAAIYVRRGASSVEANYEELQRVIDRRLETGYSAGAELELQDHLGQLRVLYQQLSRMSALMRGNILTEAAASLRAAMGIDTVPNPEYADEDFDAFIARAIDQKKRKILEVLGIDRPA